MDPICLGNACPFSQISWLWYAISVVVVFGLGALWYGKFFSKSWLKAVDYKCPCGADIQNGEECKCESNSVLPMIFQFIATLLIGLMYFVLVALSAWVAILVVITVCGWMKSTLKFQIAEWKRFMTLALIDVGYFFIASLIFIGFALIHCC